MAFGTRDGQSTGPRGPDVEPARTDRFGLVFLLLLASFIATAVLAGRPARPVSLLLYVAALTLALRSGQFSTRAARPLRWGLIAGSAIVAVLAAALSGRVIDGLAALWSACIVLFTIVVVLGQVLRHQVVTTQTIFGALCAYLLVGFLFAALFTAAAKLTTQPLFSDGEPADSGTIQYFAFVTLTTTGYGDLTPAGQPGRSLAVLDALSGQIFLVTLVARLVSVFGTTRQQPPDRGRSSTTP